MTSLEERIERKRSELEALETRKAARLEKEAAAIEKVRVNAGMQVAGTVWRVLGVSWDEFDPETFEKELEACASHNWKYQDGSTAPMFTSRTEKADLKGLKARWRSYASAVRNRSKANKEGE